MAKRWGRVVYSDLGYRLSNAFDMKWGDPSNHSNGEELLKTDDSSTVCDFADIYNAVDNMSFIPVSMKGYFLQLSILVLPFVPLVLTEHSLLEILKRIIDSLV